MFPSTPKQVQAGLPAESARCHTAVQSTESFSVIGALFRQTRPCASRRPTVRGATTCRATVHFAPEPFFARPRQLPPEIGALLSTTSTGVVRTPHAPA
jgi:hypothetical protein